MQLELKMYKKRLLQPSPIPPDIQFEKIYRVVLEEQGIIVKFDVYFKHDIFQGMQVVLLEISLTGTEMKMGSFQETR